MVDVRDRHLRLPIRIFVTHSSDLAKLGLQRIANQRRIGKPIVPTNRITNEFGSKHLTEMALLPSGKRAAIICQQRPAVPSHQAFESSSVCYPKPA